MLGKLIKTLHGSGANLQAKLVRVRLPSTARSDLAGQGMGPAEYVRRARISGSQSQITPRPRLRSHCQSEDCVAARSVPLARQRQGGEFSNAVHLCKSWQWKVLTRFERRCVPSSIFLRRD